MDAPFKRGDRVRRVGGSYSFQGIVLACYETLSGRWMATVEHSEERGMLHVFRAEDIVFRQEGEALVFRYTNWQVVASVRSVIPARLWVGKTEHHPEEQWLLKAHCLDRGEERDFAIKDMVIQG